MVVEFHTGHTVASPDGEYDVRVTSYGYQDGAKVRVTTCLSGGKTMVVDLDPEDALDLALYLLREHRLVTKGSG